MSKASEQSNRSRASNSWASRSPGKQFAGQAVRRASSSPDEQLPGLHQHQGFQGFQWQSNSTGQVAAPAKVGPGQQVE